MKTVQLGIHFLCVLLIKAKYHILTPEALPGHLPVPCPPFHTLCSSDCKLVRSPPPPAAPRLFHISVVCLFLCCHGLSPLPLPSHIPFSLQDPPQGLLPGKLSPAPPLPGEMTICPPSPCFAPALTLLSETHLAIHLYWVELCSLEKIHSGPHLWYL